MIILGLTGSIGMGKTTAANYFRLNKIPVYDADKEAHTLMCKGGAAVNAVKEHFDGVVRDNAVDRQALGQIVFNDERSLATLEGILHPLIRLQRGRFLTKSAIERRQLVVLDIPLLFETGQHKDCDRVAVVTASKQLQELRVMSRPGMTKDKFDGTLERQMFDQEKRKRADFIIRTGLSKRQNYKSVVRIIEMCRKLSRFNYYV